MLLLLVFHQPSNKTAWVPVVADQGRQLSRWAHDYVIPCLLLVHTTVSCKGDGFVCLFHVCPSLAYWPAPLRSPADLIFVSHVGQQPAAQATGLSIHLSSNNPFRNRAASPSSIDAALAAPPASPFDDPPPPPRPLSRNPFLDHPHAPLRRASDIMLTRANTNSLSAEDIFVRYAAATRGYWSYGIPSLLSANSY